MFSQKSFFHTCANWCGKWLCCPFLKYFETVMLYIFSAARVHFYTMLLHTLRRSHYIWLHEKIAFICIMLTSSICISRRHRDVAENRITIVTSFSEDNIVLVCISYKGFGLIWELAKTGFFSHTLFVIVTVCKLYCRRDFKFWRNAYIHLMIVHTIHLKSYDKLDFVVFFHHTEFLFQ